MPSFSDPEQIEHSILHELASFQDLLVLEIGFGDGRMARHYVDATRLTIGMDSDFEELLNSRSDYLKDAQTRVRLVQGRAEALPYPDHSFDPVILGWSL